MKLMPHALLLVARCLFAGCCDQLAIFVAKIQRFYFHFLQLTILLFLRRRSIYKLHSDIPLDDYKIFIMKVSLPNYLSPAIASIHWNLQNSQNPMYYEPLSSLRNLRKPESIPSSIEPIMELSKTIEDLTLDTPNSKENVILSLALILIGNGFADEAHDLITPLSWNEDTYFGGPTLVQTVNNDIIAKASYVHMLLHRWEGFAMGEYSMIGYQNSNYWWQATMSRQLSSLPLDDIRNIVLQTSKKYGTEAEDWCIENVCEYWDARVLSQLCATVSNDASNSSSSLRSFAEKAAEMELRVLLKSCFDQAGYNSHECLNYSDIGHCPDVTYLTKKKIDQHLAQVVAQKVSSAHVDAFESSEMVTIRQVNHCHDAKNTTECSKAVAAGLACRLLGSSAVKECIPSSITNQNNGVHIFLPSSKEESQRVMNVLESDMTSSFYGGGSLNVGDAFISTPSLFQCIPSSDNLFSFLPCDSTDKDVIFVDRFHGSRGKTPTSVIQWSKGTIFESQHIQKN
jgi:hypothetical protein